MNYFIDINSNEIIIHNVCCSLVNYSNEKNTTELFDIYDEAWKYAKLEGMLKGYKSKECNCCSN